MKLLLKSNIYRVLKSFPSMAENFKFSNNSEYKITEIISYPTYNVKRENIFSFTEKQLGSSIKDLETKKENSFIFDKENNNKRVIVVDNEQDILFTYRAFLNI